MILGYFEDRIRLKCIVCECVCVRLSFKWLIFDSDDRDEHRENDLVSFFMNGWSVNHFFPTLFCAQAIQKVKPKKKE